MKITNLLGLPDALYNAVKNDPYSNGNAWRSVTQLIAPPRQVVLKKRHDHEIEEDCADRLYALYGQIVHQILERSNTKDLVEERLFTECRGLKISGGFDVLQLQESRLVDWKFSTAYKAMGEVEEWVAQTNLLALLFRRQKQIEIKELEICLLMRDHSKPKARRESDYPQHAVKRIPVKLWTEQEQELYLHARVDLHLAAEKELPDCTRNERWARPEVFAVMKAGNKRAQRLFDNKIDADNMIKTDKNLFLETRPGESVRCFDYCSASKFCSQFDEERKNGSHRH